MGTGRTRCRPDKGAPVRPGDGHARPGAAATVRGGDGAMMYEAPDASQGQGNAGASGGRRPAADLVHAALETDYGRLSDLIESIPIGIQIFVLDAQENLLLRAANATADRLLGIDHADLLGARIETALPGLVEFGLPEEYRRVAKLGLSLRTGSIAYRHAGAVSSFEVHGFQIAPGTMVAALIDVSERDQREQALRKLSQAVEHSPVVVVILDRDGNVEYVNPRFTEVTGYDADEIVGAGWSSLFAHAGSEATGQEIWRIVQTGGEWRGELTNRKKNGEIVWEHVWISPVRGPDGSITHFIAIKEDITLRKDYERQLLQQANYDTLTGLPNRSLTLDRLGQAVTRARRADDHVALLFIDLDDFKKVNDTLGHAAGDELLIEAARRLRNAMRGGDIVGRLGGDEFLVVLPDLRDVTQTQVVVRKILETFTRAYQVRGHDVATTASIGVAVFPRDGDTPNTLLQNADAAMYRAKESGRNQFKFFASEMNAQARRRLALESQLRSAVDRGELSVVYQPLIDLRSQRLMGGEALLRWRNRSLGDITPDDFIGVAEQSGLIAMLGEFVIRTACRHLRQWRDELGLPIRVAVNVSARQFRGTNLVGLLATELRAHGIPPHAFEIEITERVLVDDLPRSVDTLSALRHMGVRISIDDFGTGYSSLAYLRRFPLNTLKIDRSFVAGLTDDEGCAALIKAIIAMAHSLDMEALAEGIEEPAQLRFLLDQGCDLGQGFLIAWPMAPDVFGRFGLRWQRGERSGLANPVPD